MASQYVRQGKSKHIRVPTLLFITFNLQYSTQCDSPKQIAWKHLRVWLEYLSHDYYDLQNFPVTFFLKKIKAL